jgi:hypothetical protein
VNEDALLELVAPRADEELVGAVLTTFVIDGRFVEEELLTTLVGLPVGSGELTRASSELHERLLAAEGSVSVFCDARGFDGARHVGAYDLHQVAAPPTFHPKIAILVWQVPRRTPTVRALITSANLTREGYRRNAEVAVLADSARANDHRLLAATVTYLRGVVDANQSAIDVLDRAQMLLTPRSDGGRRLLTSRGRPLLEQFFDELADDEVIESAVVVSPFFERSTDPNSASVVDAWCRTLTARADGALQRARFFVPERFVDGRLVIELPIARAVDVLGSRAELWTLDSLWQVAGRTESVPRPLHGKLLAIRTDRRCLALAGSANFTNAALLTPGGKANWEASVVLSLHRDSLDALLPTKATQRDPDTVRYQAPEPEPPLPVLLFERARYDAARRRLEVEARKRVHAQEGWELFLDGERIAGGAHGVVRTVVCPLARHPVNFSVEQRTTTGSRHIPIEAIDKENLPLPGSGLQPRGDDVLDYFAGLRSTGEFDATRGNGNGELVREELPALEHLSRFSRALFGVQDFLDRPARSVREYRARWTGAWGLQRIVELLEKRITSAGDDPAYSLFELWELEATLGGLKLAADDRCPGETKSELREATLSRVRATRLRVERTVGDRQTVALLRRAYEAAPR